MVGELVALLVTVTLPAAPPVAAGENVTVKVAFCPGVRICPVEMPPALNPGPATLTFETVTLEFPELVSVTALALLLLTLTLPKFTVDGFAINDNVAAFIVRVALLLVTLPAELLTTTLNTAPLSALVVPTLVYDADVAPLIAVPFLFHW